MNAKPTLQDEYEAAEAAHDEKQKKIITAEIKKMDKMYPKLKQDAEKAATFLVELDKTNRTKKPWYTDERRASFEK